MIIVRFQGGLGNQISQYAFCRRLQYHYPEAVIKADLDFYIYNHDHQGFELEKVFEGIQLEKASVKDILRVTGKISHSVFSPNSFGDKVIKGFNFILPMKSGNRLSQNIVTKYPEETIYWNLDMRQDWYLDGYWHSYDYSRIMDQLRKELIFVRLSDLENRRCEKQIIEDENSVSVHIRGGDYIGSAYDLLDARYYREAIQTIKAYKSNLNFYLFSDSIEIAKKIWTEVGCRDKVEYIDWNKGANSYYDMHLMSLCRYNIIANSTFSYWAAQINSNKNKIVVRPKMQTIERESWDVKGWLKI